MPTLVEGSNAPLIGTAITATLTGPVDFTALVLSADGKVSGDGDMVFFNQPATAGLRLQGRTLHLNLDALRPAAERVVLVASPERVGATFAGLAVSLAVEHGGAGLDVTAGRLSSQSVAVLAEVYRRDGTWRVRAVGQGYDNGLAGLAGDFGIDVDDEVDDAVDEEDSTPAQGAVTGSSAATAAAAPAISFTKGEDQLPPQMRTMLNVRKQQVALVLSEQHATGLRARVVIVLDVSGSTSGLYRKGVFARAVERVAPVAAQVDDGAEMQAWAMGAEARRLDDITIATLPRWIQEYATVRYEGAGGRNDERATIEDVARYTRADPVDVPTLVLFFHDGGVTDDKGTEKALRAVEDEPVFWQFIGLGRSNYGILQRLDTLTGRRHDNTGFFALDDIDQVPDAELYERLLAEFPTWMRSYYPSDHPTLALLR